MNNCGSRPVLALSAIPRLPRSWQNNLIVYCRRIRLWRFFLHPPHNPHPLFASLGNRAQNRDCDIAVNVAHSPDIGSCRSQEASKSAFRLFSLLDCSYRQAVDSSVFHLLVVHRKYCNRTSSLSIRAFALSSAIPLSSRNPSIPSIPYATVRHLSTWVFPLCFAGSARNTPRLYPVL